MYSRKLEKYLKISQEKNRQSFNQIADRILSLVSASSYAFRPQDLLSSLKQDYLSLTELLIEAQGTGGRRGARWQIQKTVESLVLGGIRFHLNFFRPNLLGLAERKSFVQLLSQMKKTFAAKNADYGNSFRFWGIAGLAVRIGDKFFRIEQLSRRGRKAKVAVEQVPDTALDLANYGIMFLMLLAEGRPLKFGE